MMASSERLFLCPQDGYPVALWEELTPGVLPGFEGFNRRATAVMIKAEVGQGQLQVGRR